MSQEQWTAVDRYFADMLHTSDPLLDDALRASAAAGLPSIHVSETQGKFLHLLARTMNARRILEVGTLGGYSTIWLARALPPEGRLVTLEAEPKHAEVARRNIALAAPAGVVEVIVGKAIDTLPTLVDRGPFDLIFIDADKPAYADYLPWTLKLSRPGTLIIADNVVRKGAVVDGNNPDANVRGVRRFIELLADVRQVSATAIQTVGAKGYDGFAIALVTGAR
jgi:predicted O-methyltransferase YrrM